MSGLPAVATVEMPVTAETIPVKQVKEASLTTERNLFEYLAHQSLANSLGTATTLANPSALATQLSRHVRGFMERASQQAETIGKKGRVMSQKDSNQTTGAAREEGAQLHAGPARDRLASLEQGTQRPSKVDNLSDQEYDDMIGAMMRIMQFAAESQAVTTVSSNTMKSLNTLMRGQ